MTINRFIPTNSGRLLIALAAAGALAFPAHAFADEAPPATLATSFTWNVQLAPDTWEGGVSPDLPDAIASAEAGETLTPDQIANIVATLTAEAASEGASTVAIAPAATPAPVAPAMPVVPSSDDGQ